MFCYHRITVYAANPTFTEYNRPMKSEFQYYKELLWSMTEKELRARYKYTFLGFLWLVINPVLQMLVIGFIFTFFIKQPIAHYYFHLFIGLLIWNFFSISLSKTTPSIVNERELIKKSKFPRSIIPLSIILSNFIHLILGMLLFVIPVLFIHTVSLHTIPATIAGFVLLLAFTTGLSLLTSALNVRFRDVNFIIQALLIVWFYATPIIYTFSFIPHLYIWFWRINPMTSIVQLFQYAFLDADAPGPAMLAMNIFIIICISIIGVKVFRKESKNFDDWV